MKTLSLIIFSFLLNVINVHGQSLSPRAQERENNEVDILTMEERWELQIWFHDVMKDMQLNDEDQELYEAYFLMYSSKMMRLDDKDVDNTHEEVLEKFEVLVDEMDVAMCKILNDYAYQVHLENTDKLFTYIKTKLEAPERYSKK